MDKYAIMCIFILVSLCIWHTAMASLIFAYTTDSRVTPDMWLTHLDRQVFFTSFIVFVLIHFFLLGWIYLVPFDRRRQMSKRDFQYRRRLSKQRKNCRPSEMLAYTPLSM